MANPSTQRRAPCSHSQALYCGTCTQSPVRGARRRTAVARARTARRVPRRRTRTAAGAAPLPTSSSVAPGFCFCAWFRRARAASDQRHTESTCSENKIPTALQQWRVGLRHDQRHTDPTTLVHALDAASVQRCSNATMQHGADLVDARRQRPAPDFSFRLRGAGGGIPLRRVRPRRPAAACRQRSATAVRVTRWVCLQFRWRRVGAQRREPGHAPSLRQ